MKYKPNPKNLATSDQEEDSEEGEEDDIEDYGNEDESDIDDDMDGQQAPLSDDDDDEPKSKAQKAVYKAAKLNPVLYEDKDTKKARREELSQKKKMSKSAYVDELRKEMYDEPEEIHMGINRKTKISKE
jgi:hypothetical protein